MLGPEVYNWYLLWAFWILRVTSYLSQAGRSASRRASTCRGLQDVIGKSLTEQGSGASRYGAWAIIKALHGSALDPETTMQVLNELQKRSK